MIRVKRASDVADLEAILNHIRPDDDEPRVIVDSPVENGRDPQYTVIWNQVDVKDP